MTPITGLPSTATQTIVVTYFTSFSIERDEQTGRVVRNRGINEEEDEENIEFLVHINRRTRELW